MRRLLFVTFTILCFAACKQTSTAKKNTSQNTAQVTKDTVTPLPFYWEGANIYFLLTDRFKNGNLKQDTTLQRKDTTDILRGFEGGDIAGITQKIKEGYFNQLGVNAIWLTPIAEQIHGLVDEGTGKTYGYHGYWAKDWTAIDPNFGTKKEVQKLVETAHENGIRILLDVVLNHTGPVTELDPVWPEEWVRTSPTCQFTTYENTTACTLVDNLPDILTESDQAVELPDALLAKWKSEGRLSKELEELQQFFDRTGYPRAPRYYIIKWLTDYIHDFGIDGFRVDTVKHANEEVWAQLRVEADYAFAMWKKKNSNKVLDNLPFYMVGEVYDYNISSGRKFNFGDKKVDFFDYGFNSLINFELKREAQKPYEEIFRKYDYHLRRNFKGKSVVNYLSSHDDGNPFDRQREKPYRAANMLMLTPGASQIYYGDETMRPLVVEGAQGDANLRSFMNWNDLDSLPATKKIHAHYQKLGQFRAKHPAIGAGKHKKLANTPYVFSRTFTKGEFRDKVVVGLDLPYGKKSLWVKGFFGDGTLLLDTYSNTQVVVKNGRVFLDNQFDTALLEPVKP